MWRWQESCGRNYALVLCVTYDCWILQDVRDVLREFEQHYADVELSVTTKPKGYGIKYSIWLARKRNVVTCLPCCLV